MARRAWSEGQPGMDLEKLVFIDETWTSTSMTRRYGRAPRGQRCIASAPHGHWKTTTFVAGLRHHQLTAPLVADGPMDGEMFLAYIRQFLCPTLRPGDVVSTSPLLIADITDVHGVNTSGSGGGHRGAAPAARGRQLPGESSLTFAVERFAESRGGQCRVVCADCERGS